MAGAGIRIGCSVCCSYAPDVDDLPITTGRLPEWLRLGAPASCVAGVLVLILGFVVGIMPVMGVRPVHARGIGAVVRAGSFCGDGQQPERPFGSSYADGFHFVGVTHDLSGQDRCLPSRGRPR